MKQHEAVHLADFKILVPRNKSVESPNKKTRSKKAKTRGKKR